MSSIPSVEIHDGPSFHRLIKKNGFIACLVSFQTPCVRSLQIAFCLHCKQLLSYSGAVKDSKQLLDQHGNQFCSGFSPEKTDFYKQHILSEIDYLCEKGKFKEIHSVELSIGNDGEDTLLMQEDALPQSVISTPFSDLCLNEQPVSEDIPAVSSEQDALFEQEWDCVEDCLLSE